MLGKKETTESLHQWIIPASTMQDLSKYAEELYNSNIQSKIISQKEAEDIINNPAALSDEEKRKIFELLQQSRQPTIYANELASHYGSLYNHWNKKEFDILSNSSMKFSDVEFYDDGARKNWEVFKKPVKGDMYFVSGHLLVDKYGNDKLVSDFATLTNTDGTLNVPAYKQAVKSRLLPVLYDIHMHANGQEIIIGLPEIGCGCFAGTFAKTVTPLFQEALIEMLNTKNYPSIKKLQLPKGCICRDNDGSDYRYHPAAKQNIYQPLVFRVAPNQKLVRLIAWDPFAYIGNEGWYFYVRQSDDPVGIVSSNVTTKFLGTKAGLAYRECNVQNKIVNNFCYAKGKEILFLGSAIPANFKIRADFISIIENQGITQEIYSATAKQKPQLNDQPITNKWAKPLKVTTALAALSTLATIIISLCNLCSSLYIIIPAVALLVSLAATLINQRSCSSQPNIMY